MKNQTILLSLILIISIPFQLYSQTITNEEKDETIESIIRNIETVYPFQNISDKTIIKLKKQVAKGAYNKYRNPKEFATGITNDLEQFSNDKHLDLLYNPQMVQALSEESDSDGFAYTVEEAKIEMWNNYGFKELSILDGNIGFLNLTVFFATEYAGNIADNAMAFFANCNALIIDLRQNGGGWGDMVDYLLGYFINNKEPLLISIAQSTLDSTYYSSVIPNHVPNKKLNNIPIYILTSPTTASAAEAFVSWMKYLNDNVIIVGKTTSGAENPVSHIALNKDFVLQIPSWKKVYFKNTVSWERKGINPDIESTDAKKTAHILALEKLSENTSDELTNDKIQWALNGLRANYDNPESENFKKYEGRYDNIKIKFDDGMLYCQYKERPFNKLIPISDTYFLVDGIDYYRIKFNVADRKIILHQIFSFGTEREIERNNQ